MTGLFKKLLGRDRTKTTPIGEAPTVPMAKRPEIAALSAAEAQEKLEFPQFEVGYAQSIGQQREHNEDALLVINSVLASNGGSIPFGLYIVADGMGGHKQGEIASGLAVRAIASQVVRKVLEALLAPNPEPPEESIQEILEGSLQEAHHLIMKEASGSGTTLTAMLLLEKRLTIAHVGDSRAYVIQPGGGVQLLTRDHSLVMRMMELGQLTEEEAAIHPQRNVLYRALGQGEAFTPDVTTAPLPEAGYLLMCSDGLWGVVPQSEIVRIVNASSSPQIACQRLVQAANAAGGPDNITVILIRLPG